MDTKIKCEQLADGWNYNTCIGCRRFSLSMSGKGTKWRCSLNNGSASEKRSFYMIWAENYLITRGAMEESSRTNIAIDYVGKKKKR